MTIARQAGPLQVDAVIALGKLKDQRAMEMLAALQRSAPRESQPTIAAAICLLGVNCDVHVPYVIETLQVRRKEPRLSGAAAQCRRGIGRAGERRAAAGAECALRSGCAVAWIRHARRWRLARAQSRSGTRRSCCRFSRATSMPTAAIRLDRRGVRHARGRLRRGELFRGRSPRVLAGGRSRRRHAASDRR